jgi:hypothetical protein
VLWLRASTVLYWIGLVLIVVAAVTYRTLAAIFWRKS